MTDIDFDKYSYEDKLGLAKGALATIAGIKNPNYKCSEELSKQVIDGLCKKNENAEIIAKAHITITNLLSSESIRKLSNYEKTLENWNLIEEQIGKISKDIDENRWRNKVKKPSMNQALGK